MDEQIPHYTKRCFINSLYLRTFVSSISSSRFNISKSPILSLHSLDRFSIRERKTRASYFTSFFHYYKHIPGRSVPHTLNTPAQGIKTCKLAIAFLMDIPQISSQGELLVSQSAQLVPTQIFPSCGLISFFCTVRSKFLLAGHCSRPCGKSWLEFSPFFLSDNPGCLSTLMSSSGYSR